MPPQKPNEDVFKVASEMVGKKFNIELQQNEIAQIHRVSGGKKIIMEFVLRGPNSTFQKLLIPNKEEMSKHDVKVTLKATKTVKRAMFMATFLKKNGEIQDFKVQNNLFTHQSESFRS